MSAAWVKREDFVSAMNYRNNSGALWPEAIFSVYLVIEKEGHLHLKSYPWKDGREIPSKQMKYALFRQVFWPDDISIGVCTAKCLPFLLWRMKSALPSHRFRRMLSFAG